MKKLNVLNKKNEVAGVAVELENGRFEIVEAGNTKEVAASTFKRWYKVVGEVVEVVEPTVAPLEELLADATPVKKSQAQEASEVMLEGFANQFATRGGKCEKIITKLLWNDVTFVITEYNGYVCDVTLLNPETGAVEYKSPKMSIKDTLEHLGYTGEELKLARKQLTALKKAAKLAM
jgi:acylphosphatase